MAFCRALSDRSRFVRFSVDPFRFVVDPRVFPKKISPRCTVLRAQPVFFTVRASRERVSGCVVMHFRSSGALQCSERPARDMHEAQKTRAVAAPRSISGTSFYVSRGPKYRLVSGRNAATAKVFFRIPAKYVRQKAINSERPV